jgi:predicted RNA-binding Zn-ribbon protein involved in translation (DUF1610 family)
MAVKHKKVELKTSMATKSPTTKSEEKGSEEVIEHEEEIVGSSGGGVDLESRKERFLVCPFCGEKNRSQTGRELSATWCIRCGKCFDAVWSEE